MKDSPHSSIHRHHPLPRSIGSSRPHHPAHGRFLAMDSRVDPRENLARADHVRVRGTNASSNASSNVASRSSRVAVDVAALRERVDAVASVEDVGSYAWRARRAATRRLRRGVRGGDGWRERIEIPSRPSCERGDGIVEEGLVRLRARRGGWGRYPAAYASGGARDDDDGGRRRCVGVRAVSHGVSRDGGV